MRCDPGTDWQNEAEYAAEFAATQFALAERGAWCTPILGYCFVFGNDGFYNAAGDQRPRLQYEELYRRLTEAGVTVLAMAVSSLNGGYTWAAMVATPDRLWLNDLVWDCWAWANNAPPGTFDPCAKELSLRLTSDPELRPRFSIN